MTLRPFALLIASLVVPGTVVAGATSCTPSQVKTVADVTVKIAEDTCHELVDAGQDPDWVHLVCVAIGVAGGVVDVVLPRQQWAAIRARTSFADAGPGK